MLSHDLEPNRAYAEVTRIAHAAGFPFSATQLHAVTAALIEGGAGHRGGPLTGSAYDHSFRTALLNGWTAAFRYKVGPGAVAEYM